MKTSLKTHKEWIFSEINSGDHHKSFKSFLGILIILGILITVINNIYSNFNSILIIAFLVFTFIWNIIINPIFLIIIGSLIFLKLLYTVIYSAIYKARIDIDNLKKD